MLIVEKSKAVALKLKNPNRVLECIPTAKAVEIRGTPMVLVPHKVDETRVLRNLGINVPAPIMHYYKWPGRFTPYEHQKQTAAFLTLNEKCLVLNDIGTGKTNSALWAADYLIRKKQIKKVLILSPLSTLERVWADAIFTEFAHRNFVVLHGSAKRRLKLLSTDVDFYIINHDGFSIIAEESIGMFDLIIVDEAAVFRNPSTRRYKMFKKWMDYNQQSKLWMMTGTPTPNEPTDAWALAKLINSPNCQTTYTRFREQVMMKIGQWKWIPKPESVDIVHHILQPAIRYSRDDCFDLPETVVQRRKADLTLQQRKYYAAMLTTLIAEVKEATKVGTISAVNEAVKLQKLIQIACGVAYSEDGQSIELDCKPRIDAVKETIRETNEKVIVFVPLTGTLHMLEKELSKHWTVGVVNGQVSSAKRNVIFNDFQNAKDPRTLIAHPGTMAHGLTLTSATTIIWYGPITSNEIYTQANGRIERIGKKRASNVVLIEGTELEHKMYSRLISKQTLQGILLDLVKQTRE